MTKYLSGILVFSLGHLLLGAYSRPAEPVSLRQSPSPPRLQARSCAQGAKLLRPVRRLVLEETPEHPIAEIRDVAVLPSGDLVVIDGMSANVRLHDSLGFLKKIVGRKGKGPGEFVKPTSVAVSANGFVLVGDQGSNRVTRYRSDLTFDTTYSVPGLFVFGLDAFEDGFLVMSYRRFEDTVLILNWDGRVIGSAQPFEPEVFSVPYWEAPSKQFLSLGPRGFSVGTTVLYPIRQYDLRGRKLEDVGYPPPSWKEPVRPKRGQFVGLNRDARLDAWVRSFSIISGVDWYRDSLLLVSHGRFDPSPHLRFRVRHEAVDVYDADGEKIGEDIPLPGPILFSGEYVYMLTTEPPAPWTVQVAELVTKDGLRR